MDKFRHQNLQMVTKAVDVLIFDYFWIKFYTMIRWIFLIYWGSLMAPQTPVSHAREVPERTLIFGKGGGFSGGNEQYTLHHNGQVYWRQQASPTDTTAAPQLLTTLSASQTKAFFAQADKTGMTRVTYHHPGNLYYFVDYQDAHKNIQARITWGDKTKTFPPKTKALYEAFMKTQRGK
jgi:hypothetical protein